MVINGNEYKLPEITFDTICKLEDLGVSIFSISTKLMSTVRGFTALAMGADLNKASREVELHLENGGELGPIMKEITAAVDASGFFQAMMHGPKAKRAPKPKQ